MAPPRPPRLPAAHKHDSAARPIISRPRAPGWAALQACPVSLGSSPGRGVISTALAHFRPKFPPAAPSAWTAIRPTPWSRRRSGSRRDASGFRSKRPPAARPVHTGRLTPDGRVLPCRPYRYDTVRCHRRHAADDPAIGQPIDARSGPGARPRGPRNSRRGNRPRAWSRRPSSIPIACCTGPGRSSRSGAGRSGTSSSTRARRALRARDARYGRSASYGTLSGCRADVEGFRATCHASARVVSGSPA